MRRACQRNWTVLDCRLRPSDVGLSHLGLTDLLRPVTDEAIGELPWPQRRALLIATLREEPGPEALDPLAVAIGLAALFGAQAARGPLLLAVDDLQWLDRASAKALAFALSRVGTQAVRCLATVRLEGARRDWRRWQRWTRPWTGAMASRTDRTAERRRAPSRSRQHARPAHRAAAVGRIHVATAGNPFYALEVARSFSEWVLPRPGGHCRFRQTSETWPCSGFGACPRRRATCWRRSR